MQHAHVNTAPRWLCHLCAQPFRGRDGYKKHMGNHVGNNLTECSVCGKWMKEIDLHMDRVHGETKVCTVCGKECVGEKNLTIHMKRVHTEPDASLKCPICAKQMWHLCVFKVYETPQFGSKNSSFSLFFFSTSTIHSATHGHAQTQTHNRSRRVPVQILRYYISKPCCSRLSYALGTFAGARTNAKAKEAEIGARW